MGKLTESSRGKTCVRCGAQGAYSCHYSGPRQITYGKGKGVKCNDLMTAEFCHKCDQVFTEGSTTESVCKNTGEIVHWKDNWDRSEEFQFWINITNIRRMADGVLVVK